MESCVFCQILQRKAEASVVYSDEVCRAFLDISPINAGHVLVVPLTHSNQLNELDEEIGGHIFKVAMRVSKALRRSGIRCEGVNLLLADGEAAGQEVPHVHLHVIPRFVGDGFRFKRGTDNWLRPGRDSLEAVAQRIKAAICD